MTDITAQRAPKRRFDLYIILHIHRIYTSISFYTKQRGFEFSFTLFADHIPPYPRSLSSLTSPLLSACSRSFCTWTLGSNGLGARSFFFDRLVRVAISETSSLSSSDPEFNSSFLMLYGTLDAMTFADFNLKSSQLNHVLWRRDWINVISPGKINHQPSFFFYFSDSRLSLMHTLFWPRESKFELASLSRYNSFDLSGVALSNIQHGLFERERRFRSRRFGEICCYNRHCWLR